MREVDEVVDVEDEAPVSAQASSDLQSLFQTDTSVSDRVNVSRIAVHIALLPFGHFQVSEARIFDWTIFKNASCESNSSVKKKQQKLSV